MLLTDKQKKMLLKLLEDEQHLVVQDLPKIKLTCTCGYTCKTGRWLAQHIALHTRTFLTPQDLMDCKEALVKKGLWRKFFSFAVEQWEDWKLTAKWPLEVDFVPWLFRTTDEKDEVHFCRLVAEFMEAQDEHDSN